MKTTTINNVLVLQDAEDENVYLTYSDSLGYGETAAAFATADEIENNSYSPEEWDKNFRSLNVGERATYIGPYGGHTFITRIK